MGFLGDFTGRQERWELMTLGNTKTTGLKLHRGAALFHRSGVSDYRGKMFTFGKERVREDKKKQKKNPTVELFNLQLGGG